MKTTEIESQSAVQRLALWHLNTDSLGVLYQSSKVPNILMLLCAMACVWLLQDTTQMAWLMAWVIAVLGLSVVQTMTAKAFARAPVAQKASPFWQYALLCSACFSGFLLAVIAVVFVPAADFNQQLLLLGLLSLIAASACIAYALSSVLFIGYVSFSFVPIIWLYLSADSELLNGFGFLVVMCLAAITTAIIQVNRLLHQVLQQREKNQKLIHSLQSAQQQSATLNAELSQEVLSKHAVEQQLLAATAELEQSVHARTCELNEALHALSKSQERLELALDASQLALWDWDLETDEVHHTRTKSIFGLEDEQVENMLSDLRPLLHPDDLPVLRRAMIEHMKQRTDGYVVEYRVKHSDGHWVWIEDRGRAVQRDASGRVLRMLGTRRDISLRKQHDEELRLASSVFDAGTECIVILDPEYKVLTVNKAYTAVTGFKREDVVGRSVVAQVTHIEVRQQYERIRAGIEQYGSWQGESLDMRKNGEIYPLWLQIHVVRDHDNKITHIVGFFTDLTARRETEERLSYLTQHDELTGLSNRALFHQRLQQAVESKQYAGGSIALLHIDLDRFKVLNDSLGVQVADQVLCVVSQRLSRLLPEADTVARLGGNEFAIVLDNYGTLSSLVRLAASLLAHIRLPIDIGDDELVISASLGISILSDNACDPAALISQANIAMQHAKYLGGDNYQFYNDQLQTSSLERLQLEQHLRRAIEEGQLQAYYQPKLTLHDGVVRSAEALVRWNHPQRGLIPPSEFIPLAEETGLIGAITELMLHQACEQALIWMQQGMPVRVSVNLSVNHVRQGNLEALVQRVLEQTGLPAYLLELELTESQLLENAESVIGAFRKLRKLGVHLAIDDFGTGYSSLSYLKRFPTNSIKIDQSFIRDVTHNDEDAAITRAIIAMAHSLNLLVVAEGVETQAQLDFLKASRCDEIQGYLISRPVPAQQFSEFLLDHKQAQLDLN